MLIRKLRLIAYIRPDSKLDASEQWKIIKEYSLKHNYKVVKITADVSMPSAGLEDAFWALSQADGIIATDLARFVRHEDDILLELRPLIRRLLHTKKVLIAVQDGIETATPKGQEAVLEMLTQRSHIKDIPVPIYGYPQRVMTNNSTLYNIS